METCCVTSTRMFTDSAVRRVVLGIIPDRRMEAIRNEREFETCSVCGCGLQFLVRPISPDIFVLGTGGWQFVFCCIPDTLLASASLCRAGSAGGTGRCRGVWSRNWLGLALAIPGTSPGRRAIRSIQPLCQCGGCGAGRRGFPVAELGVAEFHSGTHGHGTCNVDAPHASWHARGVDGGGTGCQREACGIAGNMFTGKSVVSCPDESHTCSVRWSL